MRDHDGAAREILVAELASVPGSAQWLSGDTVAPPERSSSPGLTGNSSWRSAVARVLEGADVDDRAELGEGTVVWGLAQVREGARMGRDCVVGRGAYVGAGVQVGDNVKVQNYALVYEPARLESGVFIGPAVVLTNDVYPRSVDPDGAPKRAGDWEPAGVVVREGASVGARAVVLAGCTVGRWSLVAAGAVVTKDVPDFALVAGCPARRVTWVGRAGQPLEDMGDGRWRCPTTGQGYRQDSDELVEDS